VTELKPLNPCHVANAVGDINNCLLLFLCLLCRQQIETGWVLMVSDKNEKTNRKREYRLNVRLEDEMLKRLNELSKEMCIAPATLGALAIAEYVNMKLANKNMQERTAQLVADKTGQVMDGILADPNTFKLMASAIESDDDSQQRLEGV